MHFDIFSLFPDMFHGPFEHSILKRAQTMGAVEIALHNIRDYATDKHQMTDDTPYGGGGGMVLKPEPIFAAVESVLGLAPASAYHSHGTFQRPPVILLSPQGRVFNHRVAQELSSYPRLVLLCGRYEGVDERVIEHLVTEQISLGDYVLSGGEIAAMAVVDALVRLIPGVLGDANATANDSHATGLLEYPHYTRPPVFRGAPVPEILLSGNHAAVAQWRRQQALIRTLAQRPDLLETAPLTPEDDHMLAELTPLPDPWTAVNLQAFINAHHIKATILQLPEETPTVPDAARALGVETAQIIKSLVFTVNGEPFLVIANGTRKIDRKALAKAYQVGNKRVKFAGADQALRITGYIVGSMPPFGHRRQLPVFIDPGVMACETVYGGGGDRHAMMRLTSKELLRVTNGTLLPVLKEE